MTIKTLTPTLSVSPQVLPQQLAHVFFRHVRLARAQIEAMTGRTIEQPLNGMRALTRATFADATPLASGWGVEAAMLVDVLRAGRRVVEVPVELTHRRTGNDIKGRVHRAMQLRDVSTALLARRFLS